MSVVFGIQSCVVEQQPVMRRLFSKCDYSEVTRYLYSVLWIDSFESAKGIDEKYRMFLSILQHAIDMFVPQTLVHPTRSFLPPHLQNVLRHKEYLTNYAKQSGDWSSYRTFSALFNNELDKFNRNMEKRIMNSKQKNTFFQYLKGKLTERQHLSGLKVEERQFPTDFEKANALADIFAKVFF
ncbi:hypothetical protein Y032_0011g1263 [Ancylostoma ceylanicum]|uniref:Uncharacterized protein n=1 Tax=Ancylostoma ceylanicum TaxID=53326 RepID=A0A016VEW8_9BILA|nr:hypothetical protein Y032_0011g1263 [Ancylostoma ceylanicum]